MTEKELIQFATLLDKFIDYADMDAMDARNKAIELRELINN